MRSFCLAALVAGLAVAQTQIDLKTQARRVDFGSASSTKPLKTGASLPATCTAGDMYFKTDAVAGQNLYGCTAANTWSPQAWASGSCVFNATTSTIQCTDGGGNVYSSVKTTAGPTANQWIDYITASGVAHTSQPTPGAVGAVADPGANGIPYRSGLGTAVAANASQMSGPFYCQDAGATDAYACNLSPVIAGYTAGTTYWFRANTANTGAASLNLNGLGARTIKKFSTQDLDDGDIRAGQWVIVTYDGTNMQLQSQAAAQLTANQLSGASYCQDAGSSDSYACTLSPAISSYAIGATYWFKAGTANTGAASLNLNGLGAKTIKKLGNTDLADGDIRAGQWVIVTYDGTNMQMASQIGNLPANPIGVGTSLPATCAVGDLYFKSNATAGQNVYGCTATNTWTAEAWNPGTCVYDGTDKTLKCPDGSGNTFAAVKTAASATSNQWVDYITSAGVAHTSQPTATAVGAVADPGANGIPYRTALGSATAANAGQMSGPFYCQDAGSTDAYACNLSPAIPGYTTGAVYWFKAATANIGAATLNLNSLGAKTIKKYSTLDLGDGDIRAGQWVMLMYDGTNMQMQSQLGNYPANPVGVGTVLPATCALGDLYIKTDAPAGQTLFGCMTANTWTVQAPVPGSLTFVIDGTTIATRPGMNYVTGAGLVSTMIDNGSQVDIQLGLDTSVVATKADVQSNINATCASLSSSTTTYTCGMSPVLTQYTHNMVVQWVPDQTCAGGATTLNIDGLGVKRIYQSDGNTNPVSGMCVAGVMYLLRYDASLGAGAWRIVQGPVAAAGWSFALDASSTGIKGYVPVPYACSITSVTTLSPASGTGTITLKKGTYSGFPSTSSICGASCPALAAGQKATDSTLSGWTTGITAGDIIEYSVTVSDPALTNVTVALGCQR